MKAGTGALQIAVEHHQAGRLAEAEALYRRILEAEPGNPDAMSMLGLIAHQQGMHARAVELIEKAHRLGRPQPFSLNNLGLAYVALERPDKAKQSFSRALKLQPDYAEAHNNLGAAFKALGRAAEAENCFRRAITLKPDYSGAHYNLANLLGDMGRMEEAERSYRAALAIGPDFESYNNLGLLLWTAGRLEEAEQTLRQAVALRPSLPNVRCSLGCVLYDLGRLDEARACFREAFALGPDFAETRWMAALSRLPWREGEPDGDAALAELQALDQWFDPVRIEEGYNAVGFLQPFYLAYREENNRELLSAYGTLCSRLMRHWLERQQISRPGATPGGKLRIGIVSAQIRDHSVWNAIVKGWCRHLDRDRFDLDLFSLGSVHDRETLAAKSMTVKFIQAGRDLRHCVDMILERQPDVLIYPEIGMDPMTVKLASLRLAAVQAAAWGHPETTGLPTIDYYLSAEDFEPTDAANSYTEKLVLLPRLGCCYQPFAGESVDADLASLGIPAEGPLLLCAGTPFKYAPRYDGIYPEIARRLGSCRIVFFRQAPQYLSTELQQRLTETFSRAGLVAEQYLTFIPKQSRPSFYGLMKRADVLLDTIGFSGFNTAMQALECGLPIVTREGHFMRGRFASGILKRLGLPELVAASEEHYIELAVKLAEDSNYRAGVRARIVASRATLYQDLGTVRALEEFLIGVARRR